MFVNCRKDKPTEAGNQKTDSIICQIRSSKERDEMVEEENKLAYQQDQT